MAEREARSSSDMQPAGAWEGSTRLPQPWRADSLTVSFSHDFAPAEGTTASKPRKRVYGAYRGRFAVPDDFFRPLTDDEL